MLGRRLRAALCVLLVAWGVAVGVAACAPTVHFSATRTIAQDGGLRVTVQLACPPSQNCSVVSDMMARSVTALAARAQQGLGVSDASAKALSAGQIEVDLPGYTNQQAAVSALTAQGVVQFIDTGDAPLDVGTKVAATQYPVLFTGSQIAPSSVSATYDPNVTTANQPIVSFEFQGAARTQFDQYTNTHIGKYLTITQDDTVIECAMIQSEIPGVAQISGIKSMADAQALAAEMKTTPLPTPVTLVSAQLIAASGA